MLEEGFFKLYKLYFLFQNLEAQCASLHPVSRRFGRMGYQQLHFFLLHHGDKFIVHRNSDSSLFFLCHAELVTPSRNCSVDTELIDRVNFLEQEFCIYKISMEVKGTFNQKTSRTGSSSCQCSMTLYGDSPRSKKDSGIAPPTKWSSYLLKYQCFESWNLEAKERQISKSFWIS